jgi:hypothetical protein
VSQIQKVRTVSSTVKGTVDNPAPMVGAVSLSKVPLSHWLRIDVSPRLASPRTKSFGARSSPAYTGSFRFFFFFFLFVCLFVGLRGSFMWWCGSTFQRKLQ